MVAGFVCTAVHDATRLAEIVPFHEILTRVEWFDHNGSIMVSPAGTLLIAEAACRADPTPVLDMVLEEEAKARHKCKHGSEPIGPRTRENERTSPEWEYDHYRRWDRPTHELLRQWCGYRAVTSHERLLAVEAENHRLDVLVAELIDALELVFRTYAAAAAQARA